jgi:hypothetical protein
MFDMRRREFLRLLGGAAAAFPLSVRAAGKRLRLALPETITFLCPNMGVSVESSFTDTEDSDEIYERVTCLACRQLHMLNLRTGKILGVRQSPIGASGGTGGQARSGGAGDGRVMTNLSLASVVTNITTAKPACGRCHATSDDSSMPSSSPNTKNTMKRKMFMRAPHHVHASDV